MSSGHDFSGPKWFWGHFYHPERVLHGFCVRTTILRSKPVPDDVFVLGPRFGGQKWFWTRFLWSEHDLGSEDEFGVNG